MVEIIIILLLVIIIIIMTVGLLRSSTKIGFYEDWITIFKKNTNSIYEEMKTIDERGSFEADDEVGVIFKSLRDLIGELNKYIIGETKDEIK